MLGVLIRKQFMELTTLYKVGKRKTKASTAGGVAAVLVLYLFLAVCIGTSMFLAAAMLEDELLTVGRDWNYFILLDILAVLFGTLITMFSADLTLFRAKDNESLLSMPIPPGYIIFARMIPLYIISLIFTAAMEVPAVIVYVSAVDAGTGIILLNIGLILLISLLTLALSSVMGWVVSLIGTRFKGNNIAKTAAGLLFIAAFYFFYFKIGSYADALVSRSADIGDFIRKYFVPLYYLGEAHRGSASGILIGVLTIVLVMGVIYFALSRTFRQAVIAGGRTGRTKVKKKEAYKRVSQPRALMSKEMRRFFSSTSYMMNCGLGPIAMVVLSVVAIVNRGDIIEVSGYLREDFPSLYGLLSVITAVILFLMISTCYYTMPSISLEGKSIWILRSLPVDPMRVFMAKIKMEYLICVPGILIFTTSIGLILKISVWSWLVLLIVSMAYTTFTAYFGLWINLLRPNMEWTNEAYPIKQGLNPLICLFGEWLLSIALGALFFAVGRIMSSEVYLMLVSLVLLGLSFVIYRWLKTGGRRRFDSL